MAQKIFHTCYSACRAFTKQQWHDYLEKEEKIGTKFGKYIVNDCDICINPDVIHFEVNKVFCYANIKWADFGNGWFAYGIDCNTNDGGWGFGVSYIDDKCAHLEWKRKCAARSKKECLIAACELIVNYLTERVKTDKRIYILIQMIKDYKKELSTPKVVQLELF